LDMIKPLKWLDNMYAMLNAIPSVPFHQVDAYYESLDSQLTVYERLRDAATLLELALWKSTLMDQCHPMNTDSVIRMQCRANCSASVIIPNVISFLVDDGDEDEEELPVDGQIQHIAAQFCQMFSHSSGPCVLEPFNLVQL